MQVGGDSKLSIVESSREGDATVLGLSGGRLSFGVTCLMFVVGSSRDCLRSFLTAKPGDSPLTVRERLRASYFADSGADLVVDLDRLRLAIAPRRERLVRVLSSADGDDPQSTLRDLDRAVELLRLFRSCFFAVSVAPDASFIHLRLGLIADR